LHTDDAVGIGSSDLSFRPLQNMSLIDQLDIG